MSNLLQHDEADFAAVASKTVSLDAFDRRIPYLPKPTHWVDAGNLRSADFDSGYFRDRMGKKLQNIQGPSLVRSFVDANSRDVFDFSTAGEWSRFDYLASSYLPEFTIFMVVIPNGDMLSSPGGVVERTFFSIQTIDGPQLKARLIDNSGTKTVQVTPTGQTAAVWASPLGTGKIEINKPCVVAVTGKGTSLKVWCNDFVTPRAAAVTVLAAHPTGILRLGGAGIGQELIGAMNDAIAWMGLDLSDGINLPHFQEVGALMKTKYAVE